MAFNILDPCGGSWTNGRWPGTPPPPISLRTGWFCNPGAGEAAFGIGMPALRRAARGGDGSIDDYLTGLALPTGGAVRVSLGLSSNVADVEAFLEFAADAYRDRTSCTSGLPPRLRC